MLSPRVTSSLAGLVLTMAARSNYGVVPGWPMGNFGSDWPTELAQRGRTSAKMPRCRIREQPAKARAVACIPELHLESWIWTLSVDLAAKAWILRAQRNLCLSFQDVFFKSGKSKYLNSAFRPYRHCHMLATFGSCDSTSMKGTSTFGSKVIACLWVAQ